MAGDFVSNKYMLDHPLWWRTRIVVTYSKRRQYPHVFVLWNRMFDIFNFISILKYTNICVSFYLSSTTLTWKTNSRELRGMVTCCVSHNAPDIATQTLAVVVTGPYFFDGNITTRYGNSVLIQMKRSHLVVIDKIKIHKSLKLHTSRWISIGEAEIIDCI